MFSKFTEIYPGRPAVGRLGPGRPAAGRYGLFCKNFRGEFALKPLEDRSPDSGAAGPPGRPAAGRQGPGRPAAGRPPPPALYKGLAAPHPLICFTKNPEKKKKREGGREGGREAKPCRIFKLATAGNQNSSTLYKQFML